MTSYMEPFGSWLRNPLTGEEKARELLRGERCSASCPTKDHETYGECLRAKRLGKPIIR